LLVGAFVVLQSFLTAATRGGQAAESGPVPQRPRERPLHPIELSLADKAKLEQLARRGATGQRAARQSL
jgi:hypothetical protein